MAFQLPFPVTIASNERVGPTGRILKLDSKPNFAPGQVVALARSLGEGGRMYSICSAPGDDTLEIIYTLVPEGNLTPHLWNLSVGDRVYIQQPRGSFRDPAGDDRVWWICNGTGVSPYISMLRHARKTGSDLCSRRVLLFGFRSPEESWYMDEIVAAGRELGLTSILCMSSPDAEVLALQNERMRTLPRISDGDGIPENGGTYVHFGRLTAWPDLHKIPGNGSAMLCGSSAMISEVRELLLSNGMTMEHIFAESYY